MALPTPKRPKERDDELREELEVQRRAEAIIQAENEKLTTFFESMKKWYINLRQKLKEGLTPILFKRRVIYVCYVNSIVYDDLPDGWFQQLQKDVGVKLYVIENNRKVEWQPVVPSEREDPSNEEWVFREDAVPVNRRKCKYFLDLSDVTPPEDWWKSYAKGMVRPRELKVYSTSDMNILYYDYNPNFVHANGDTYKFQMQPRHDVNALRPLPRKRKHPHRQYLECQCFIYPSFKNECTCGARKMVRLSDPE